MQDKYLIPIFIFLGAISIVSLGAGIYNFQNNAVNELSAELSNRLNTHETHIEDLNESIDTLDALIDAERLNNIAMAEIILELEKENIEQQISIAILEARGDKTTQPSGNTPPVDTIQLQLKISDNKGNTKSGYPRDVPAILIQGESTFLKQTFLITIKDPNGAFVKDKFGQTLNDGDISEAWIPTGTVVAGTYTVTIKIDLKTDSIQFTLL